MSDDIEALAAEAHAVYQSAVAFTKRENRHPDNYADLPEEVKELDRWLVRWAIGKFGGQRDAAVALADRLADGLRQLIFLTNGVRQTAAFQDLRAVALSTLAEWEGDFRDLRARDFPNTSRGESHEHESHENHPSSEPQRR